MAECLKRKSLEHIKYFSELIDTDVAIVNAEVIVFHKYNDRNVFRTILEIVKNSVLIPTQNAFNDFFMKPKSETQTVILKVSHSNPIQSKGTLIYYMLRNHSRKILKVCFHNQNIMFL